jgi:hypothetical protein
MDELVRTYIASPTFTRVHASQAAVRGVMGPVGSGKTVGCFNDWWFNLAMTQPANKAGVRKRRLVVVRNTYPELQLTSIKTFIQWFGELAKLRLSVPIEARMVYPMDDGTKIEAQVIFLSMDRPVDVKKLKSLDASDVFLNEASELSKTTFDMATARIGRYPREGIGKDTYECRLPSLLMDTNPCDDDHWYYLLAERPPEEEEKLAALEKLLREVCGSDRRLFEFFRQPPAMLKMGKAPQVSWVPNPAAENIENLPGGYAYYITQMAGKTEDWIKVFVQGDYGVVTAGRPVYPEFSQSVHVNPTNHVYDPRLPLVLGWDFGHTPSVEFAQITPRGRLIGLDELCGESIGLNTFVKEVVAPHIRRFYSGAELVSTADPAGEQGSQHDKEQNCIKLLNELGIPTRAAHSNDPTLRRESVVEWMQKMVGGEAGMSLSPKQRKLVRGMAGKYFYQRLEVSGEARYRDVPVKNMYSHPCEAWQYLCMGTQLEVKKAAKAVKQARASNGRRRASVADATAGY